MVRAWHDDGMNPPPESYPTAWQDAVRYGEPVVGLLEVLPWSEKSTRNRWRLFIKTLREWKAHPWHAFVVGRAWHWRVSTDGRHYLIWGTLKTKGANDRVDSPPWLE